MLRNAVTSLYCECVFATGCEFFYPPLEPRAWFECWSSRLHSVRRLPLPAASLPHRFRNRKDPAPISETTSTTRPQSTMNFRVLSDVVEALASIQESDTDG